MNEQKTSSDPLLQPFQLKHLTIRNRVISTSHAIGYQHDGMPKEQYQRYHEEKAKGGIGLTMFGGSATVAQDSPSVFGQLEVYSDEIIDWFQQFSDRIHSHGAALMCQISHLGRRTVWNSADWLPTISASYTREPAHRCFAREMDHYDIKRVIDDYANAARRCKEGGLDGVEILIHGHLPEQFWRADINKRTDKYGGDLRGRITFSIELLEAVRKKVGDDFIVGLRMNTDEEAEDGLQADDYLQIANWHAETGMVDFFNLNSGRLDTMFGLAKYMPTMAMRSAPYLEQVGKFKQALNLPVLHACRVNDVATARHAIRNGLVDLIAMTRGHLADPHIVNKIMRGEEERIRPCVGAGHCSTFKYCMHSVATGREESLSHDILKAEEKRKVVVVGGGPGGLEAARISAERGHEVVLFEANKVLGGQIELASKATWRADLKGIVDWRVNELEHLGVRVKTNVYAEANDVLAENPDTVIVASGGLPYIDHLEGSEHCMSVWDVLGGEVVPDGEILIFDGVGRHQALSCAEVVAKSGRTVELVTPDQKVGVDSGHLDEYFYLEHFDELGVSLSPNLELVRVVRDGEKRCVFLKNTFTGREQQRVVDGVILENGTEPLTELFDDLKNQSSNLGSIDNQALLETQPQSLLLNESGKYQLFRIGDAMSSRDIHSAMLDAYRLCVSL